MRFIRLKLPVAALLAGAILAASRTASPEDAVDLLAAIVRGREITPANLQIGWWLDALLAWVHAVAGSMGVRGLAAFIGGGCGFAVALLTARRNANIWSALAWSLIVLSAVPPAQWAFTGGAMLLISSWALVLSPFFNDRITRPLLIAFTSCAAANTTALATPIAALLTVALLALTKTERNPHAPWKQPVAACIGSLVGLCCSPAGFSILTRWITVAPSETALFAPGSNLTATWLAAAAALSVVPALWSAEPNVQHTVESWLSVALVVFSIVVAASAPTVVACALVAILSLRLGAERQQAGLTEIAGVVAAIAASVLLVQQHAEAAAGRASPRPSIPSAEVTALLRSGKGAPYCSPGSRLFAKYAAPDLAQRIDAASSGSTPVDSMGTWAALEDQLGLTMAFVNGASEQGRLSSVLLERSEWRVALVSSAGILFARQDSGLSQATPTLPPPGQDAASESALALNAYYAGWREQSRERLDWLMAQQPNAAVLALAQIAVEKRNWSEAVEMSGRALASRPHQVRALYIRALGLSEADDLRGAYRDLTTLLDAAPNDLPSLILAARIANKAGDYAFEARNLQRAARVARGARLPHGVYDALRAQALLRAGNPRRALNAYRAAIEDPALGESTKREIQRNIQALRRGIASNAQEPVP